MKTKKLRALLAMSEYGSISSASEHLFISQPTLSRYIMELEEELGITIFNRSSDGLSLTMDGQHLKPFVSDIINAEDRLMGEAKTLREYREKGAMRGELNIGYHIIFSEMLAGCASNYLRLNPNVEFGYTLSNYADLFDKIIDRQIDAAIFEDSNAIYQKDLDSCRFARGHFGIAVGQTSPLAKLEKLSLSDIASQKLVAISRNAFGVFIEVSRYCIEGFTPVFKKYFNNISDMLIYVSTGAGICFIPFTDSKMLFGCLFKEIDCDPALVRRDLRLVWRKDNAKPLLRSFIDYIKSEDGGAL